MKISVIVYWTTALMVGWMFLVRIDEARLFQLLPIIKVDLNAFADCKWLILFWLNDSGPLLLNFILIVKSCERTVRTMQHYSTLMVFTFLCCGWNCISSSSSRQACLRLPATAASLRGMCREKGSFCHLCVCSINKYLHEARSVYLAFSVVLCRLFRKPFWGPALPSNTHFVFIFQ